MNPNNTGSFGAAIGGSDALKQAMARRGMDASILDQQSPGAAGTQPPVPTGVEGTTQTPSAGVTEPTPKQPDTETLIATKALAGLLKSDADLKKTVVQMRGQGLA